MQCDDPTKRDVTTDSGSVHLQWHRLAELEQLPTDGSGMTCEAGGRRIALFRVAEGTAVYALDDECPHQGASLGMGIALQGEVGCPWHSWHFDLETGRNTDGLSACVEVFPWRIVAGWVEVGLRATSLGEGGAPPLAKL